MHGVVGDLGSKRIIAWEVSSESDLDVLVTEVRHYVPSFNVHTTIEKDAILMSFNGDQVYRFFPEFSEFLCIDLFRTEEGFFKIFRDEFYRRFKRAF